MEKPGTWYPLATPPRCSSARDSGRERSRRERIGRAGRRRIVERYGIEKMVQDYADLYHRLGGASAGAVAKRPKRLSTFRMGFLRSDR